MTTHEFRKDLGNLTQDQFARMFGISVATVKNWDARDCMPAGYAHMLIEIIKLRNKVEILESTILLLGGCV